MKAVLLFLYFSICDIHCNSKVEALSIPDGYLLGMKVREVHPNMSLSAYNQISLFTINFNGTVSKNWNYTGNSTYAHGYQLILTVDIDNELVYLGTTYQFKALDLRTGTVKIEIPLASPNYQYFVTYDYYAKDKAIYGVCGSLADQWCSNQWCWCHLKQNGAKEATIDLLYKMPYTNEIGPEGFIYYFDTEDQTIWYYPGTGPLMSAVGVNFTSSDTVFESTGVNPNDTYDSCIAHDHTLGRVFTYVQNATDHTAVGLSELFPKPKQRKILMKAPPELQDLGPAYYGSCDYDQKTHTMIGLMATHAPDNLIPSHLLFLDVVGLSYKLVPLPTFKEKWGPSTDYPTIAVKYIAHT